MPKNKVGISSPKELVHEIDRDTKDVLHRRCMSKILRWSYDKAEIDSLEVGFVGLVSSESMR
jgi:hypothetical protein